MTRDMWGEMNILSNFSFLPITFGGEGVLRIFSKRMNDSVTEFITKVFFKAAPTTPGLFNIHTHLNVEK